jgi:hypothetical protein
VTTLFIDHVGYATWHMAVDNMAGEAVCTMGFTTDNDDVNDVADRMGDHWAESIMPMLSGRVHFYKTNVRLRLAGNIETGETFRDPITNGGTGSAMLPAQVAVLVQKRTQFAGKHNRGRFYLPGIDPSFAASSVDNNSLTTQRLGEFQAAADALYAKMIAAPEPCLPVILHSVSNLPPTAVDSFSVSARFATQRGRIRD